MYSTFDPYLHLNGEPSEAALFREQYYTKREKPAKPAPRPSVERGLGALLRVNMQLKVARFISLI